MNPNSWREMVDRARELEVSLGSGIKKVEDNEQETVVLQRRALRFTNNLEKGTVLTKDHLEALRPCPTNACLPEELLQVVGRTLLNAVSSGDAVSWSHLD